MINPQIRELMPQAYEMVRKNHGGYFDQNLLLNYMAILVVKECAELVEYNSKGAGRDIREHFGVER